jgi:hypothetical protein
MNTKERALYMAKRLDEVFELVFTAIDARIDARLRDIANKMCPPPAAAPSSTVSTVKKPKPRRKGPIQLCPVPKCKNRAAPVFGMVCAQHKGIAKKTIAKYRAARRAKGGR